MQTSLAPKAAAAAEPALPMLQHRYMLLTHIPCYLAADGSVWLDRLWHHDFVAHLRYLKRLTLVCPHYTKADQPDLVRVDVPADVELSFIELPHQDTRLGAVLGFPGTVLAIGRAVSSSDIVHSGVAGWPYPLGWVANPLALLFKRKLIVVIESAPWRLTGAAGEGPRKKIRAVLTESFARWSANRAHLGIFTQPKYRDSLMTRGSGVAVVAPATWIDERDVLDEAAARRAWERKPERLRVLFAGRLVPDKGVAVLIEAARALERRGVQLDLDIIGEGALRVDCEALAGELQNTRVHVLDPVQYGAPFFELLRGYHALLVPSLSDEQPRIVFDAYAQAVPVIASDTDGLRPNVEHGVTGQLVPRGDAMALADVLAQHAGASAALRPLGVRALAVAHRATHRGMHETRWQVLLDRFGAG